MRRNEIHQLVVELLAAYRWVDPAAIDGNASLIDDLGLDSADATELLVAVHERTGVKLRVAGLGDLGTVDDVVSLLAQQLDEGAERHHR